jgi:sugar phosphate isomerase/epimerase
MAGTHRFSRRNFLAATLVAGIALRLQAQDQKRVPIGILLYAVQADLDQDFNGTLAAIAKMGFEGVEFTHYFEWTPARAREVRALLDSLHLRCFSTHNEAGAFSSDGLKHAVEINQILGSRTICCVRGLEARSASPAIAGKNAPMTFERMGLDSWKKIADVLQQAAEHLRPLGMVCTFHNHAVEFVPLNGVKPIDILAQAKDVAFHIDVNVCRGTGTDLVAFIKQHPGRINSLLLTDGPRDASRRTPLLGQGATPWKEIFAAAEGGGGVQYYLLAQAGGGLPPMQALQKELEQYKLVHG